MSDKTIIRPILISAFLIMCAARALGQVQDGSSKDYILLISSYSHDSRDVTELNNDFDLAALDLEINMETKIESLGVLSLCNIREWRSTMNEILARQSTESLRGIVLIGQEAWGTFLSLDSIPDVPFYGCKITEAGIFIPDSVKQAAGWEPPSISTRDMAIEKRASGAIMYDFDIVGTMQLAMRLYPDIKNVALLSDNSYGGLSLLSKFREVMKSNFFQMKTIELDGRKLTASEIRKKIDSLPEKTIVLLGTWRVDKNCNFYQPKDASKLFRNRPDIPTFTPTSLLIKDIAIGGWVPNYRDSNKDFLKQILTQISDSCIDTTYIKIGNHYELNAKMLRKFKIDKKLIPKKATIYEEPGQKENEYRSKFSVLVIVSASMIAIVFVFMYLVMRLRYQNDLLNSQKEELKRSEEMAKRSDRLKSTFLRNLSHEINTPANGLLGFINLIEDTMPHYESEYSSEIKESATKLLDIINKIVDFSKLDSGILEFEIEKFDIAKAVEQVRQKYDKACMAKGLRLETSAQCQSCIVEWDKGKTIRILSILTENAIKFTHKGNISIGFLAGIKKMTLFVSDTGIGICQENQSRIFEKFEKIDSLSEGTGLGLAYIKAIAEKSGGSAHVVSKPDYGSRFIIEIPCNVITPPASTQDSDIASELYDANSLMKEVLNNQFKILVADNSDVGFNVTVDILRSHNIKRACNGNEAVEALRNDWFDLVLMDVRMPEKDGIEATREIRKFDKQTPIIAVISYSMNCDTNIATEAGCNALITKPITRKNLYDAILKLM